MAKGTRCVIPHYCTRPLPTRLHYHRCLLGRVEETTQSGHLVMTLNSDGRPAGPRTIVGLLPEAVVGATDTDVDHAAGR